MNQNPNTTGRPSSAEGQGNKIADEAKQLATNAAGQAKNVAANAVGQVKQQAASRIDSQKERAVGRIEDVASAVRAAGDSLEEGPLPDLAERAADGIESFASYFKSRTVGDLLGEVESFGRREPAIFLGAAFALGLLGGRFLKSSSTSRTRSMDRFPDHFGEDLYGVDEHRFETMRGLDYTDRTAPAPQRMQRQPGGSIEGTRPQSSSTLSGIGNPSTTGNRGGGAGQY
jgi:hypothetical protein